MELDRLRYFYEVAKSGSVTAAARTLRISQPSLSKTIRLLEQSEGVTLFLRGKQGVTLTEEGQLVYRTCQRIFGEIETLRASIAQNRDVIAGELAFGASDNICNYILPRVCSAFMERYPEVKIQLFSGSAPQIQAQILERRIEFGLFYTNIGSNRELVSEKLSFAEFAIVSKKALSFKDLQKTPYIGSRSAEYATAYPALEMLGSLGVRTQTVFETNNQETQKRLALEGVGYTVVPLHMVKAELAAKTLHRVRSPEPIGSWIYLVRKQNLPLSRIAQLFQAELLIP